MRTALLPLALLAIHCGSDNTDAPGSSSVGPDSGAAAPGEGTVLPDGTVLVPGPDGGLIAVRPDASAPPADSLSCGPGTRREGNQCVVATQASNFCVPTFQTTPGRVVVDSNLQVSIEGGLLYTGTQFLAVYGFAGSSVVARTIAPNGTLGPRRVHAGFTKTLGDKAVFNNGRAAIVTNTFGGSPKLLLLDDTGALVTSATLAATAKRVAAFRDGFAIVHDNAIQTVSPQGVIGALQVVAAGGQGLSLAEDPVRKRVGYVAPPTGAAACQRTTAVFASSETWSVSRANDLPTSASGFGYRWASMDMHYARDRYFLVASAMVTQSCSDSTTLSMDMVFGSYDEAGVPLTQRALGLAGWFGFDMAFTGKFGVLAQTRSNSIPGYFLFDANGELWEPALLTPLQRLESNVLAQTVADQGGAGVAFLYERPGGPQQVDPHQIVFARYACP